MLEKFRGYTLFIDQRSEAVRVQLYFNSVENIMNERVLGELSDASSWKFSYDEKMLGTISLENTKVRKVVERMNLFVDVSVTYVDRQLQWKQSIPNFLTVTEKSEFQKNVDEWFANFIYLTGRSGLMNYIHLLCTGHLAEYMHKWRNLYEHSQQGWEAFNLLLKSFCFCRTQCWSNTVAVDSALLSCDVWVTYRCHQWYL
jgi:hypothetical protein